MISFNLIVVRLAKLLTREESWLILRAIDRRHLKTKMRSPVRSINSGRKCKGRGCSGSRKLGKR